MPYVGQSIENVCNGSRAKHEHSMFGAKSQASQGKMLRLLKSNFIRFAILLMMQSYFHLTIDYMRSIFKIKLGGITMVSCTSAPKHASRPQDLAYICSNGKQEEKGTAVGRCCESKIESGSVVSSEDGKSDSGEKDGEQHRA